MGEERYKEELQLLIRDSGGGNGLSSFPTSVHFDIPIVDGDAMGRAYPTMYHGTFFSPNLLIR